jgi:hypothetical protein
VTIKNAVYWNVTPCGFVRTDVYEERIASIIKVKKVSDLGRALTVTSN